MTLGISIAQAQTKESICEDFYNKLLVAQNLEDYTTAYVDRNAEEKPYVPSHVWSSVKESIDYAKFESAAVNIICNAHEKSVLEKALLDNRNNSFIEIGWPLRIELINASEAFKTNEVDKQIALILRQAGY